MFDMKAEFGLTLQSPEGPKKVVVKYPDDNQVIEWRRKKKIVQKALGRSFEIAPSKPEACDVALLSAIRIDKEDGPQIDEAEAFYIIGQLTDTNVTERPEREGSLYTIRMKVMRKLYTSHSLRIPSVKEQMDYDRMRSSVVFLQYGNQEIRLNYRASGELYDQLRQSTEGYRGDVPVAHKAEAINVLLQEIRAKEEEPEPESDEDQD